MTVTADSAVADAAVARVHSWLAEAHSHRESASSGRLARLVADPEGLAFAVAFVDGTIRPEDSHVAARNLAAAARMPAPFLSRPMRAALSLARLAPVAPWIAVPITRRVVRALVGHLVLDARPARLTRGLRRLHNQGVRLNVNLLGEAVLGNESARQRRDGTIALIERPDVDYVSLKVSSVVAPHSPWGFDDALVAICDQLRPIYQAASRTGTFVNLDMEEYRDLDLTIEVFTRLLAEREFSQLHAGIVLQAYLPDALGALDELTTFAVDRVARGGARIKVRLVTGANLAMEHVEAELHGWPLAPYGSKEEVDANYVRLLDAALTPFRAAAVRLGVASHNLFDVALAVGLARRRGVMDALDLEMLQGMAPGAARAVRDEVARDGGHVVLYTPVVRAEDFDVAISYLVRRLEENAAPQNFLHAAMSPTAMSPTAMSPAVRPGGGWGRPRPQSPWRGDPMSAQRDAFRASVAAAVPFDDDAVAPHRTPRPLPGTPQHQDEHQDGVFRNAVDTDPAVAAHRAEARRVVDREASGYVPVTAAPITSTEAIDSAAARAVEAGRAWAAVPADHRAAALDAIGRRLEARRSDLVAALVHEAGKTVTEADPEVSEAVDFAHYYAGSARGLDHVPGARFAPGPSGHGSLGRGGVVLVTPPWNFPVAIPAGGVLAALAAGSAVLAKPASPTPRCFELTIEAVHAGLLDAAATTGLTPQQCADLVQLLRVHDRAVGRHLVTHDAVDHVILTGSIETAELFASWKPERPVLAETSGKNAIVVTASADLDLAVADVVRSAFGHAGQKCSAASLAILVGSVGDPATTTGERFRRQLVDAVRSLTVGPPTSLASVMGPLTEPAAGKLERALTTLEPGETWLVRPRRLAAEAEAAGLDPDRLWTPGLREGVAPGSFFHLTEVFGPVLGIMTAATLDEALDIQNGVAFGLTAGLHSLDAAEIAHWSDRVQAGNLYVNRHITGAIVQRQPFGGWKASSVGPGAKAGGPHYVAQLGSWADDDQVPSRAAEPEAWLAWATADDARAWAHLSAGHDPSALAAEENVFRLRPVAAVTVRVGDGALPVEIERVLAAARTAGVRAVVVPAQRSHEDFAAAVAAGTVTGRIRVIGAAPGLRAAAATRLGTVTVLDAPVVASGERELLAFVREQAVSRTRHRYGHLRP
jgi:RHH-type proline utilization regulon transcriptional repressor/proline dehydrogenase/delta 1-pyrroline-5-carboxylate dehydrogenase